jgi:hypothetical protein
VRAYSAALVSGSQFNPNDREPPSIFSINGVWRETDTRSCACVQQHRLVSIFSDFNIKPLPSVSATCSTCGLLGLSTLPSLRSRTTSGSDRHHVLRGHGFATFACTRSTSFGGSPDVGDPSRRRDCLHGAILALPLECALACGLCRRRACAAHDRYSFL